MSGRKHSEETKQIMSDAAKKIDNSGRFKPGENHPNYGQPRTEGAGKPSQQIEVTDMASPTNNTTISYDSISGAARALNLPNHKTIANYIKNNKKKPYKGRYTFKKKKL